MLASMLPGGSYVKAAALMCGEPFRISMVRGQSLAADGCGWSSYHLR